MGRNIKSLAPDLVAKVEEMLEAGLLQKKISKKVDLDIRWISDISVARKKRLIHAEARRREAELVQKALEAPDEQEPDAEAESYTTELRNRLRKAIPVRARVKAIKDLLESPNAQLKKAGLDQLNAIEGIGKKGGDKPYEPAPMFVIDTVPDFKPRERKKRGPEEDEQEGDATGGADDAVAARAGDATDTDGQ